MSFAPKGAHWYLADLVMAIHVKGATRVAVHVNTTLVRARSAVQAFSRALKLGRDSQAEYMNAAGRAVKIRFVGLRELNVIHDQLEHGAELTYRVRLVASASEARKLTNRKTALAVFKRLTASPGPDYASGEVLKEMAEHLAPAPPRKSGHHRTRNR